jgi:hypothetical protein
MNEARQSSHTKKNKKKKMKKEKIHPIWLEESSKLQPWARSIKFAVFGPVSRLNVFESICLSEREEKRREEEKGLMHLH